MPGEGVEVAIECVERDDDDTIERRGSPRPCVLAERAATGPGRAAGEGGPEAELAGDFPFAVTLLVLLLLLAVRLCRLPEPVPACELDLLKSGRIALASLRDEDCRLSGFGRTGGELALSSDVVEE